MQEKKNNDFLVGYSPTSAVLSIGFLMEEIEKVVPEN